MSSLPILSDALRRRFEREERRHANMRRVFGYRLPDGSLDDNLIVHAYNDISACRAYFEHVFSLFDYNPRLSGVDFVYLGVWYKDKRKFDFIDMPEKIFSIDEVINSQKEVKK